jgi:hypothetical protein
MESLMTKLLCIKSCSLVLIVALMSLYAAPQAQAEHDEKVKMRVQCETLDRTILSYTIDGFERRTVAINGDDHLLIYLDHAGCPIMDQAGNPQLPALRRSIMIPDSARMELRILDQEYHDIENVLIAPWKGPIVRSVDSSSVPYFFSEVYEEDAWYPRSAASLQDPYILHDVRGAVVEVFPFQYNPVKKVLRVYTRIEVEVKSAGMGQVNTIDREAFGFKPDRSFGTLYERHFVNHAASRTEPPSEDGDMLVICHGPFMEAMEPFVEWKNSIGIPTTIVDAATVGSHHQDIKAYIEQVYNSSNLAYVLLVGDYHHIECPYFWGGVSGISDPSYSLMTPDKYPDLFIGRFSAENHAHVDTQVRRTIEYEQEGHDISMGEWNTWGIGIADDDGPFGDHYHENDDDHMHKIRDELLAYGFTHVDPFHPTAKKHYVSKSLNEGRRILNYCGHGGNHGWGTSGFSVVEVDELTNVGRLPFINAVACEGGIFKDDTCLGETWLRATHNGLPTGAIACYMCSTGMYGPQPMFAQGNHAYFSQYGGADRFWMEMNWSLAGCWFGGSCLMMDLCGDAGVDMFMTWHIFGDPSLRLTGHAKEPTLLADGGEVPLATPKTIHFTLSAGSEYAGNTYFLLAGVSGTYPGATLPSGLNIPLNFDAITMLVLTYPSTSVFQNFYGTLNGAGEGAAAFSTQDLVPLNGHLKGAKIFFVAVVWPPAQPYKLVTNVITLYLVE